MPILAVEECVVEFINFAVIAQIMEELGLPITVEEPLPAADDPFSESAPLDIPD